MKTKVVLAVVATTIGLSGCQTIKNFSGLNWSWAKDRMKNVYQTAEDKVRSDPQFLSVVETSSGKIIVDGVLGQVVSEEVNSEIRLTSGKETKTAEFGINYKPTMERFIEHKSGQQVATMQSKYMNLLFDQVIAYTKDYPNAALTINVDIHGYANTEAITGFIPALNGCNFNRVDAYFVNNGEKIRYMINLQQGESITDNKVLSLSRACVAYNLALQHKINKLAQINNLDYTLYGHVGKIKGVKISVFVRAPY